MIEFLMEYIFILICCPSILVTFLFIIDVYTSGLVYSKNGKLWLLGLNFVHIFINPLYFKFVILKPLDLGR